MFSYLNRDTEPYEAISGVGFPMHIFIGAQKGMYILLLTEGEVKTDLQLILCQAKGLICFI